MRSKLTLSFDSAVLALWYKEYSTVEVCSPTATTEIKAGKDCEGVTLQSVNYVTVSINNSTGPFRVSASLEIGKYVGRISASRCFILQILCRTVCDRGFRRVYTFQ